MSWVRTGNIRGPTGPNGVLEVYEQKEEPITDTVGALWITPPPDAYESLILSENPSAYYPQADGVDLTENHPGILGSGTESAPGFLPRNPSRPSTRFTGAPNGGLTIPSMRMGRGDPVPEGLAYSFEFWINFDVHAIVGSTGQYVPLLEANNGNPDDAQIAVGLYFAHNPAGYLNRSAWATFSTAGRRETVAVLDREDAPGLQTGVTRHVVMRFAAGPNSGLFFNGAFSGLGNTTANRSLNAQTPNGVRVGAPMRSVSSAWPVLQGRVQELAFYEYALSTDQIREHYEVGMGGG